MRHARDEKGVRAARGRWRRGRGAGGRPRAGDGVGKCRTGLGWGSGLVRQCCEDRQQGIAQCLRPEDILRYRRRPRSGPRAAPARGDGRQRRVAACLGGASHGECQGCEVSDERGKRSCTRSTCRRAERGDDRPRQLVARWRAGPSPSARARFVRAPPRAKLGAAELAQDLPCGLDRDALAEPGRQRRWHGEHDRTEVAAVDVGEVVDRALEVERTGVTDRDAAGAVDAQVVQHAWVARRAPASPSWGRRSRSAGSRGSGRRRRRASCARRPPPPRPAARR